MFVMDLLRQTIRLMLLEGPKENIINQGWPEEFAETLIDETGDNIAPWIARQLKDRSPWKDILEDIKSRKKEVKFIVKQLKKGAISQEGYDERKDRIKSDLLVLYKNLESGLLTIKSNLEDIIRWAVENKVNLKKYDLDSAEEAARVYVAKSDMSIVKEFPDGWFWANLEVDYCEIEAKAMGHCGRADDGELWSLRDPQNNPHVTAEVVDEEKIVQMKGKQNKSPDSRYHQYIVDLLADPKVGIEYYSVQNLHGSDLTFDELTSEQIGKIRKGNPDLEVADPGPSESEWEERMDEAEGNYNFEYCSVSYGIEDAGADGMYVYMGGEFFVIVSDSNLSLDYRIGTELQKELSNNGHYFQDISIEGGRVWCNIPTDDFMPNPDGYEEFLDHVNREYENDAEEIEKVIYSFLAYNGYIDMPEHMLSGYLDDLEEQYSWKLFSPQYDIDGNLVSFWATGEIPLERNAVDFSGAGGINEEIKNYLSDVGYSFEKVDVYTDQIKLYVSSETLGDFDNDLSGYEEFLEKLDYEYEDEAEPIINAAYKFLIQKGYAKASEAYNALTDKQFQNFDVKTTKGDVSISTSDVGRIGSFPKIDDRRAVEILNIRSSDIINNILRIATKQVGAAGQLVLPGIDKPLPKEMSANGFMIDFDVGNQNSYYFDIKADLEAAAQVTFAAYLDQNWENVEEYIAKIAHNILIKQESKLSLHRAFSNDLKIKYNRKRSIHEAFVR